MIYILAGKASSIITRLPIRVVQFYTQWSYRLFFLGNQSHISEFNLENLWMAGTLSNQQPFNKKYPMLKRDDTQ